MQLKEFVSETIKQIIEGVKDAQQAAQTKGAVVVPYSQVEEKIEFDVAVTAVEGTETSGKAGISVWSIGAGVSGKSESSTSTLSRIKFLYVDRYHG
ncbi:MAG: trypco2 family protein [Sedimentisphaerales bacterium]